MSKRQVFTTYCPLCDVEYVHGHAGVHWMEAARCAVKHLKETHGLSEEVVRAMPVAMELSEVDVDALNG